MADDNSLASQGSLMGNNALKPDAARREKGGTLFFAGGHGWHFDRSALEAERLALTLGYSEGITLPDPGHRDNSVGSRCTVMFSDGHVESMKSWQAHKVAADPEVVSIVSEWQMKRAEQLLFLLDGQYTPSGGKIDVIANSASALTTVLALRQAAIREGKEGIPSPFGSVVLAYPAGLIKKASRFEDQKRVMQRAKNFAVNHLQTREGDVTYRDAKRKFGREGVLTVVRKLRSMRQKATTSVRQMKATGGVREQVTAAVSLHTDVLRQLGEMNVSVSLVLGDKDVMFPAELVLGSINGGVKTVLVTDTNHGWGKPGRSSAVEANYSSLTSKGTRVGEVLFAEGVSPERQERLIAALGERAQGKQTD